MSDVSTRPCDLTVLGLLIFPQLLELIEGWTDWGHHVCKWQKGMAFWSSKNLDNVHWPLLGTIKASCSIAHTLLLLSFCLLHVDRMSSDPFPHCLLSFSLHVCQYRNRRTFMADTSQASLLCGLHLCLRIHMAYPVRIAGHSVLPFARPQGKRDGFPSTHGPCPIQFTTPELGVGKGSVNQRPSHLPTDTYAVCANGNGKRGLHWRHIWWTRQWNELVGCPSS